MKVYSLLLVLIIYAELAIGQSVLSYHYLSDRNRIKSQNLRSLKVYEYYYKSASPNWKRLASYQFDTLGRITESTDAQAGIYTETEVYDYSAAPASVTYMVLKSNEAAYYANSKYNTDGRLTEFRSGGDSRSWEKYLYDSSSYQLKTSEYKWIHSAYTAMNKWQKIYGCDTFVLVSEVTQWFDKTGKCTEEVGKLDYGDRDQRFVHYVYDHDTAGRLTKIYKAEDNKTDIPPGTYMPPIMHMRQEEEDIYNEAGNLIEHIIYNEDCSIYYRFKRDYDVNNNCVQNEVLEEIWGLNPYKMDDEPDLRWYVEKMSYNGRNQITESGRYTYDGELEEKTRYVYDDNNMLVRESNFNEHDELVLEYKMVYQYYQ